jgi:hypothetical protein
MLKLLGCVTTIIHTHAQLFLHFWSPQNKIIEKLEVHDVARGAASRYIFHLSTELFFAILLLY